MADEQGLDDVARLLADGAGAGRVVGARPGNGPLCDLELLILTRVGAGYRLRSVVAGLDRIGPVGNHLFEDPPPDTFTAEDVTFETLEDAWRSAGSLTLASRAVPIPGRTRWLNAVGFTDSLSRSKLRSEIGWLAQPPRWWEITKTVLIWAYLVVVLGSLVLVPYIPDADVARWMWFLAFLVSPLIILGLVPDSVVGLFAQRATDWIERRLERPRDRPQSIDAPSDLATGRGARPPGAGLSQGDTRSSLRSDETGARPARRGQGRPESFMVHGHWRFGFVVVWVGAVIVAAGAANETLTVDADPLWARVPVAVFALATVVALYRTLRRGVGADPGGVTVVNFRRSYRLRWEDLREVSFHLRSSLTEAPDEYSLEFLLTSGGSVIAAKPTDYRLADGGLRRLRDRIHAAGEAALPGQLTSRQPMRGKAQVVRLDRNRLESADVEVAIIMPTTAGRYRHRRLRCRGSDVPTFLAYLFDPDAAAVVTGAEPSDHRWVQDQDFDTADEAVLAAHHQDPLANLGGWLDEAAFRSKIQDTGFKRSARPEAERLGAPGRIIAGVTFGTIFAVGMTVGGFLFYELGIDEDVEALFGLGFAAISSVMAAWWAARSAAELIRRRNLARERDRQTTAEPAQT